MNRLGRVAEVALFALGDPLLHLLIIIAALLYLFRT